MQNAPLLLIFLVLVCSFAITRGAHVVNFGQTCGLSGSRAELGIQLSTGISAAFKQANAEQAFDSTTFNLILYDDRYDASTTSANVYANGFGTNLDAQTTLQEINQEAVPIIGSATGLNTLRNPFQASIVNIRASFADEVAAIVQFALTKRLTRISMLHGNDTFGYSAFESLMQALNTSGLPLESSAIYRSSSADITPAVDAIFSGKYTQAVILVGDPLPLARAIKVARDKYFPTSAGPYFLSVSSVGTSSFPEYLRNFSCLDLNIFSAQVVPPPHNSSMPLVKRFQNAMETFYPTGNLTVVSLEGYLVGRFLIDAVERVRENVTSESLLNAIYRSSLFYVGGLALGPFLNETPQCNQGSRQVFLTKMSTTGRLDLVTDFTFKWQGTCSSFESNLFSLKKIVWGRTAGFRSTISLEARWNNEGILAAFAEANKASVDTGISFQLEAIDDGYLEDRAYNNTITLLRDRNVFGLLGSIGTAPNFGILRAIDDLGSTAPIVGSVSGAKILRIPYRRNVINVRVSYIDEATAMISFLNRNLIGHVAVLYQADPLGYASFEAVSIALNASGLPLESFGTFQKGTLAVEEGMQQILRSHPGAIIVIGPPDPVARAIQYARSYNEYGANATFLTASLGLESLHAALKARGQSLDRIYATQTVPPPLLFNEPLVQRYKKALREFDVNANATLASLEGYMVGLFAVEVTSRIRGQITPAAFIDTVYDSQTFAIEKLALGPFTDGAMGSTTCNQGLHTVWMTKLEDNENLYSIVDPTYIWKGSCLSATSDVVRPIVFGQSASLSGRNRDFDTSYRSGIVAAFNRFNRLGGLEKRQVILNSYDDKGNPNITVSNTKELIDYGVIALLGYVGSSSSYAGANISKAALVPFIAASSGASFLRSPCHKYVVNMRSSYTDEVSALVTFLRDDYYAGLRQNRAVKRIAVFYENDVLADYMKDVLTVLTAFKVKPLAVGSYEPGSDDVMPALSNITRSELPDAILMIGDPHACAMFIQAAKGQLPAATIYAAISLVSADLFAVELARASISSFSNNIPTIYVSAVMPSPTDRSSVLVQEYLKELSLLNPPTTPSYASFEGYAAGRFATRTLTLVEGELTRASFATAIYEKYIYNLQGYLLGPFSLSNDPTSFGSTETDTVCNCSQGSHQVWLTFLESNYSISHIDSFRFSFNSCGVSFSSSTLEQIDLGLRATIMVTSALTIFLVVACGVLLVLYRETKTMSAASPLFLFIMLAGSLMLAISPFLAINWPAQDTETANNVCMSWIWFLGLGFTLTFAPLAVKTYRVFRIFNNKLISSVITLQDSDLLLYLAIPVGIEMIILVLWTALAPMQLLTVRIPGTVDQYMQLCSTKSGADQGYVIAQSILFGVIALFACLFAFRTRNIKYGAFKESSEILFAAYNLTFFSIILVPMHSALTYNVVPSTIIRTIGVSFQVLVLLGALFGIKLYRIITNNERMSHSAKAHSGPTMTVSDRYSLTATASILKSAGPVVTQSAYTASSFSLPFQSENTTFIRSEGQSLPPSSNFSTPVSQRKTSLTAVNLATLSMMSSTSVDDSDRFSASTLPSVIVKDDYPSPSMKAKAPSSRREFRKS